MDPLHYSTPLFIQSLLLRYALRVGGPLLAAEPRIRQCFVCIPLHPRGSTRSPGPQNGYRHLNLCLLALIGYYLGMSVPCIHLLVIYDS